MQGLLRIICDGECRSYVYEPDEYQPDEYQPDEYQPDEYLPDDESEFEHSEKCKEADQGPDEIRTIKDYVVETDSQEDPVLDLESDSTDDCQDDLDSAFYNDMDSDIDVVSDIYIFLEEMADKIGCYEKSGKDLKNIIFQLADRHANLFGLKRNDMHTPNYEDSALIEVDIGKKMIIGTKHAFSLIENDPDEELEYRVHSAIGKLARTGFTFSYHEKIGLPEDGDYLIDGLD